MAAAPLEFEEAPEVEEIAERIIPQYHQHLLSARVRFIFRSKHIKRNMRVVLGTATLCTGRLEFLSNADFIIEIAQDCWYSLSDKQKLALVDHELCHCVPNDKPGPQIWAIREHDVEEFEEIIRRHGCWKSDLFTFSIAILEDAFDRAEAPT